VRPAAALHRLPVVALRDAARHGHAGDRGDQGRTGRTALSSTPGQSLVEAQRIEQRTRSTSKCSISSAFCKGIENYSRHLSGRQAGEPPPTLIDYLAPMP
jgi:hypothetical protein